MTVGNKEYVITDRASYEEYHRAMLQNMIDEVDLDNLGERHIYKGIVAHVLKRMLEERDFSDKYMYDFICEHWSSIENGDHLEYLAYYLEEFRYGLYGWLIEKQLRKQLKKQIDKDGYITIYRGFNDYSREDGNSYTLSRNVAIWYSMRFAEEISYVNTYKIHIDDVLAFITDRNEAEIIASPDAVILLETNSYSDKVKISAGCKVEYINNL
jgi:hypothetical protein